VAASEEIFNIWTDGINALLGKKVSNCNAASSFDDVHVGLCHGSVTSRVTAGMVERVYVY